MLPRIGYGNTPSYTLFGGYTLGQETDAQLYSFITSVGASIRTSTLYGTNLTAGVDVREGWALGSPQVYDTANLGLSVYDETRHDYT